MEDHKSGQTRCHLVDTARQLFASRGLSQVTMNDIARVSGRSRRTLYAYFQSRDQIYHAVIEAEAQQLLQQVLQVHSQGLPPGQRIPAYIRAHLDAVKRAVDRNGGLRSDFFSNVKEVERARLRVDLKEKELLREALQEGQDSGVFKPMNVELTATLIFAATRGVEIPYIRHYISDADFKVSLTTFVSSSYEPSGSSIGGR